MEMRELMHPALCRVGNFVRDQNGRSLIEVIVATGILAGMSVVITMAAAQIAVRTSKIGNLTKIDVAKTNVASLILSNSSWQASVNASLNSSIKNCLQSASTPPPCQLPSWCSYNYNPRLCTCRTPLRSLSSLNSSLSSCPSSLAGAQSVSLYDASGSLFYNAQNAANGFNSAGEQCGPDAPLAQNRASQYPSPGCPFRFDLRWYAIPSGSGASPVIGVKAALQVAPGYNTQMNKDRYSVPLFYRPAK